MSRSVNGELRSQIPASRPLSIEPFLLLLHPCYALGLMPKGNANGLEPCAYLRRLFAELPKAKTVEDFERDLYSSGTRIAMLCYGVPLVSVIGALLGGWLAWWSYPRNRPSNNRESFF
jgi:hypothetical protein